MKHLIGKAAPMFLVLGIVSITEALVVCLLPANSIGVLDYLFPFAIILQGTMQFAYSAYKSFEYPWLLVLYLGAINIATGHFMIFYPHINDVVLLISVGMTWVSTGTVMLLLAWYLYREMVMDSLLIASGLLSFAAGFYLLTNIQKGVESVLWITVLYNFLFGLTTFLFGIKVRRWSHIYFDDIME